MSKPYWSGPGASGGRRAGTPDGTGAASDDAPRDRAGRATPPPSAPQPEPSSGPTSWSERYMANSGYRGYGATTSQSGRYGGLRRSGDRGAESGGYSAYAGATATEEPYPADDLHGGDFDGGDFDGGDFDDGFGDYEDWEEFDGHGGGYRDIRWRWVAGIAAVVLLAAVVATMVLIKGDSTSTTALTPTAPSTSVPQDAAPATSKPPRTVIATAPPGAPAPVPDQSLAPETVVTVTPTPSADAFPAPQPPPPPPPAEAPAPDRVVTYTVTGNRQLIDLVTIIYSDEQGFPRTDINVALPWSKTLTLNPGVQTRSVTATSLTGQLNCAITDGAGAVLVAQDNNSPIATCSQ